MELFSNLMLNAVEPIRIFGIKLFDVDFWEMLMRLTLCLLTSYSIIRVIYQPTRQNSEYVFTFMVFSPIVFFVCHLFASVELSIGFAFGLFAVFSILRYRTTTIQVKEMSYMFVIIAISVINALATKKVSYVELLFTNMFIIGLLYMLERFWSSENNNYRIVLYERIENIKPANEALLLSDLSERLGRPIKRYDIIETDFMRDVSRIRVYFND